MKNSQDVSEVSEKTIKLVRGKTLELLKYKDRTEQELRNKLSEKGFCDELIEEGIQYAYSFHYLDDVRYAEHFIRIHRETYSTAVIRQKLMIKGVSSDDLAEAFHNISEEEAFNHDMSGDDYIDGETSAAITALRKKLKGPMPDDSLEGQKILAYMYRKGFRPDTVKKAIEYITDHY